MIQDEAPFTGPLTEEFWNDVQARQADFDPDGWKHSPEAERHEKFIARAKTDTEREARTEVVRSLWAVKHSQSTSQDVERISTALREATEKVLAHATEGR